MIMTIWRVLSTKKPAKSAGSLVFYPFYSLEKELDMSHLQVLFASILYF